MALGYHTGKFSLLVLYLKPEYFSSYGIFVRWSPLHYRYCNFANYRTSNGNKCDDSIPVIVIGKLTIPVGGCPQDLPKFQMPCLTLKSVLACWIHSPDSDCKVSLKKNDPFMPNGRPIVVPPVVTSDWLMTESWLAFYWLFTGFCTMFYAPKHHNYHPNGSIK